MKNYDQDAPTYMLAFNCAFYFLLYIYFDRVMPNEYGVKETPFFCIRKIKKCFSSKSNQTNELLNQNSDNNQFI